MSATDDVRVMRRCDARTPRCQTVETMYRSVLDDDDGGRQKR